MSPFLDGEIEAQKVYFTLELVRFLCWELEIGEMNQFLIEMFYFYFIVEKDQEEVSRPFPKGKEVILY